jgi:hypothetical protein
MDLLADAVELRWLVGESVSKVVFVFSFKFRYFNGYICQVFLTPCRHPVSKLRDKI